MIIRHGTLSLHTITSDDLELLRNWRNDKDVNKYLITDLIISHDQQIIWYNSLDFSTSIYFLFRENDIPIGLAYAREINTNTDSFEGSIFIGDKQYLITHHPVKASLMLSYLLFEKLHFKTAYSIVHRKNKSALDLDNRFGYKEIGGDINFVRNTCTVEDYLKSTYPFRKFFFKNELIEIIYENGDEKYTFQRKA